MTVAVSRVRKGGFSWSETAEQGDSYTERFVIESTDPQVDWPAAHPAQRMLLAFSEPLVPQVNEACDVIGLTHLRCIARTPVVEMFLADRFAVDCVFARSQQMPQAAPIGTIVSVVAENVPEDTYTFLDYTGAEATVTYTGNDSFSPWAHTLKIQMPVIDPKTILHVERIEASAPTGDSGSISQYRKKRNLTSWQGYAPGKALCIGAGSEQLYGRPDGAHLTRYEFAFDEDLWVYRARHRAAGAVSSAVNVGNGGELDVQPYGQAEFGAGGLGLVW